jgi:hypothetical protein
LDDKALRRGVFPSVGDLKAAIEAFLAAWNNDPNPFVWTATVEAITEKLARCRQTLERIQPGSTAPLSRKWKKKRKNDNELSSYFVAGRATATARAIAATF